MAGGGEERDARRPTKPAQAHSNNGESSVRVPSSLSPHGVAGAGKGCHLFTPGGTIHERHANVVG